MLGMMKGLVASRNGGLYDIGIRQYGVVGGLEAIVFGSIRWCVWSFQPSSPLRSLPHLKYLLFVALRGRA